MDFGMPTLIEHNNLEETAALCHELGLDFIELNMNLPQYQIEALENIDKFQRIADQYQLYYTIHLDENLNVCDFNRAVANAYLDTIRRTIEVAKKLRAPILNMHMNHGIYVTLPDRKVKLYEKYNDHYMADIKKLKEMCDTAVRGTNIKIAIENTDGYCEYEKKAIEYLLESDAFTLTWDIGHSHVCDNVDVPFIMEHVDQLKHFHIHDASGKKNHLTLGTGEIDLRERLLIAKGCGARCVIETKTIESLRTSIDWLRINQPLQ